MELILGISLTVNGFFIGLYLFGKHIEKQEKKILEKRIEGFTKQYIKTLRNYADA